MEERPDRAQYCHPSTTQHKRQVTSKCGVCGCSCAPKLLFALASSLPYTVKFYWTHDPNIEILSAAPEMYFKSILMFGGSNFNICGLDHFTSQPFNYCVCVSVESCGNNLITHTLTDHTCLKRSEVNSRCSIGSCNRLGYWLGEGQMSL